MPEIAREAGRQHTARQGTAVQISTYPMDLRLFEHMLPHHIRVWSGNVDRIVVTIDTHQTRSGRYSVSNFAANLEKLRQLVKDAASAHPNLEVNEVDYSEAARGEVARYFFDRDSIPVKAWDGGPFYSYFFALHAANAQYVMHIDADMMFGGGSSTWMREAMACMKQRPDVLVMAPFPGPPRADDRIFGHGSDDNHTYAGDLSYTREDMPQAAYRHRHVSSRAFMIDLNRLKDRYGAIPWVTTAPKQKLKAILLGHPTEAIEAEVLLSAAMRSFGCYRIDMLGASPGMWSLHPPYRSEEFFRRLPEFIRTVESGDVPDGQRGHYDLNDSMIDWSQARAANHWHKRHLRMIRQRLASVF